jgi:hypothetical protein
MGIAVATKAIVESLKCKAGPHVAGSFAGLRVKDGRVQRVYECKVCDKLFATSEGSENGSKTLK